MPIFQRSQPQIQGTKSFHKAASPSPSKNLLASSIINLNHHQPQHPFHLQLISHPLNFQIAITNMPPKHQQLGVARGGAPRRGASNQGYFGAAYTAVTSKENRSVVQSIGIFTVSSPSLFPIFALVFRNPFQKGEMFVRMGNEANEILQAAVAFFSSSWSEFILPPL